MPQKIISEELKQEIRNYYLSAPMSLTQVAEKFNLSSPTVGKILKDIPRYTKARIFNPELKEDFF
jgi:DNA-binding transcriptional regulator LsrR (DeoR family)